MNRAASSRSQPRGRAGGRASGSGHDFQDLYVTLQLAKLLTGDRDPPVEVMWEKKALDFREGAGAEPVHVDDAIVSLSSGKTVYVQVKEAAPKTGWSSRQLIQSSVAHQFWQQWESADPDHRKGMALRLASPGDTTALDLMAEAALRSRSPQEMLTAEASAEIAGEIAILAAGLGLPRDSNDLWCFLRCLQAEPLHSATELEARIIQTFTSFGSHASDLARRLTRIVGRSKHIGPYARAALTRDTLIDALREDGFPEERLIAAGIVPAKPVNDATWDLYRQAIGRKFRTFRVYGLQVDRAVYADLPALFVPLRLAPIPAGRLQKRAGPEPPTEPRSLADRLSAEAEREEEGNPDDEGRSQRNGIFDLTSVLQEKNRFALVGGPGVGKTTTLKMARGGIGAGRG